MKSRPKVPEWWKDFFSGLTVEMWRSVMPPEQTGKEVDFIQNMLEIEPPSAILDVPCGYGRHSIELASRGFSLTAADISMEFLDLARTEAAIKKVKVTWEHREMRDLPWKKAFDGAYCFGNSFGYLDDEGNAAFLRSVHNALKRGARFVLDASSVAENVIPGIKPHTEMQFDDIRFIEDNVYDHVLSRLNTEYTFVRGNRTEKKFGSHRLYTYREFVALFEVTGFEDCRTFGSLDKEPYSLGSDALFVVGRK